MLLPPALTFVFYSPMFRFLWQSAGPCDADDPRLIFKEPMMDEKALFLQFWDKEATATRKVISRIPEKSDYRPDPKSRTAREIAWLIVREEIVLAEGLEKGALEWIEVPAPATA